MWGYNSGDCSDAGHVTLHPFWWLTCTGAWRRDGGAACSMLHTQSLVVGACIGVAVALTVLHCAPYRHVTTPSTPAAACDNLAPAPHVRDSGVHTAGEVDAPLLASRNAALPPRCGWRYDRGQPCRASELEITPTAAEARSHRLSEGTLDRALSVFRRCGVVAIRDAIPRRAVEALRRTVDDAIDPYVVGRARLRETVRRRVYTPLARSRAVLHARAGTKRLGTQAEDSLEQERRRLVDAVWGDLVRAGNTTHNPVFTSSAVRERNDGRMDVSLPFSSTPAVSDPALVFSPFVYPILAELLGLDLRLKGVHAVVALDHAAGVRHQHWHRDSGLLFEPDGVFAEPDVHDSRHGVHLPPFGINVFVPLVDFTPENGPTEFTLGSHQWGSVWADDEGGAEDVKFFVPAGTAVIADYRTVHRGTDNRSGKRRHLAMMIFGREWWSDAVNYGRANVGGARAVPRRYGSFDALVSEMDVPPVATAGSTAREEQQVRLRFAHLARIWRHSLQTAGTRYSVDEAAHVESVPTRDKSSVHS